MEKTLLRFKDDFLCSVLFLTDQTQRNPICSNIETMQNTMAYQLTFYFFHPSNLNK